MKLFDNFEAVKFPEENLIFVTHDGYLYYIYNPKYETWRKHRNAGNDHITVNNYQEIGIEELRKAMTWDNKARFKFTMLIAFMFSVIGISFLFVSFIPGIISLWLFGMAVGMFVAGLFGLLFGLPVIDSVSVHMKVIDYVDNVIRNTEWTPNNLMDGSMTAAELVERENEGVPIRDIDDEGDDGYGEEAEDSE